MIRSNVRVGGHSLQKRDIRTTCGLPPIATVLTSPAKKDRKIQSAFGKDIPDLSDEVLNVRFAQVIADALHRDFGETHSAVKIVVGLTKANERAVKNWFTAKNGPLMAKKLNL
jgi:hypothetical protein